MFTEYFHDVLFFLNVDLKAQKENPIVFFNYLLYFKKCINLIVHKRSHLFSENRYRQNNFEKILMFHDKPILFQGVSLHS